MCWLVRRLPPHPPSTSIFSRPGISLLPLPLPLPLVLSRSFLLLFGVADIEKDDLVSPLDVIEILSRNPNIRLGSVKEHTSKKLTEEQEKIEEVCVLCFFVLLASL